MVSPGGNFRCPSPLSTLLVDSTVFLLEIKKHILEQILFYERICDCSFWMYFDSEWIKLKFPFYFLEFTGNFSIC